MSGTEGRGPVVLGVALALLLTLETWQIGVESREFTPNTGSLRGSHLRQSYWPQVPLDDQPDPLADWLGLQEFLPEAGLDPKQIPLIRKRQEDAGILAQSALEGYTALLEPLTPEQRRDLLEPQRGVVDHRALGLDSAGSDLILLWAHRFDVLAGKAAPSAALEPPPEPVRLPLTRIAAGMMQLQDLQPGQARAVLDRLKALAVVVTRLHRSHEAAVLVLTPAQVKRAAGRPLRRAEPFPSPFTLERIGP